MSAEIAEKAGEVAGEIAEEAVEETVDGVVEVVEMVRNNPVAIAVAAGLGLVAGGVAGYFVARKVLSSEFEQRLSDEIAEAKAFYAGVYKTDEEGNPLTPQEVLGQLHGEEAVEAVREYQGRHDAIDDLQNSAAVLSDPEDAQQEKRIIDRARIHHISVDAEKGPGGGEILEVRHTEHGVNVFADDTFDLAEELKYRTADKPYIITYDEFYAAERDFDTNSLVYYEQDDTLVDERDKPIDDVENIVGTDHLVRFGSGSKDKNIVFVRNEKLETDYEITRSKGSYLEEVLGLPPENRNELRHSSERDRRRAFRRGDE